MFVGNIFLREAAKNILFLVDRPLSGGGGIRAWPLKKQKKPVFLKRFFLFSSQSKIKHILFKEDRQSTKKTVPKHL